MASKQKGLTLIELLVVISIIGLLSAVVIVSLSASLAKARDTKRVVELQQITKALEIYWTQNGSYPLEHQIYDTSMGCGDNLPTGNKWCDNTDLKFLINDEYFSEIPVDPKNSDPYYYYFEPYESDPNEGFDIGVCGTQSCPWQLCANQLERTGEKYCVSNLAQVVVGAPPPPPPPPCYANGTACASGDQCCSGNCYRDADGDGYVAASGDKVCKASASLGTDCDDTDSAKWQNLTCYPDSDGDTYYSSSGSTVCSGASCPSGYSGTPGTDCNDADATRWRNRYTDADGDTYCPSNTLTCVGNHTGYRDSCTTFTDCNDASATVWQNLTCYVDADGDTYTVGGAVTVCKGASCTSPAGHRASASFPSDCYDANANAKPGQTSYFTTHRGDGSFDYNCDDVAVRHPWVCDRITGCSLSGTGSCGGYGTVTLVGTHDYFYCGENPGSLYNSCRSDNAYDDYCALYVAHWFDAGTTWSHTSGVLSVYLANFGNCACR